MIQRHNMDTISPYLDEHRPEHQEFIDGVAINPNLRSDFDVTANDDRDPSEVSDWWGRPFIKTDTLDENFESWEAHVERLKDMPFIEIAEKEAFEAEQANSKKSWLDTYPEGIRYQVRCLDGGAWDRSTNWGMVGSLDEAMRIIKERSS